MKARTLEAYQLLQEGVIALAQVEGNGIRVDLDHLSKAIEETEEQITEVERELKADPLFKTWRRAYGEKTNLESLPQLAKVLFEIEGYEVKDKTASERPKMDEEALDRIDHPFVRKYQRRKKLTKVSRTYLRGIRKETVGGIMHPIFDLHVAKTYRSNSSKINFQNFPIRNPEFAEVIRRCFIAHEDDEVLVEIDYGGIEVKVAACYHKDPQMLEYINDPTKDMHRDMAAQCYIIDDPELVTKDARYAGKNMFVFPQFYGDFYVNCARSLWNAVDHLGEMHVDGVNLHKHLKSQGIKELGDCVFGEKPRPGTFEQHLQEVERDFWNNRFQVYGQWKKQWWNKYLRTGGFALKTGFYIEGVYSRNDVINYPVQGAAFHCLLWSLIRLQRAIKKRGMRAKIVGQIHDSIVASVPESELADFLQLAKSIMTVQLPKAWDWIITPLEIEAEVAPLGASWYDKKEVKL